MEEVVAWLRSSGWTVLEDADGAYRVDSQLVFNPPELLAWANAHRRVNGLEAFPAELAEPRRPNRRRQKGLLHLLINV